MKRTHKLLAVGALLAAALVMSTALASAQGIILIIEPDVTCTLPGEDGWCRGDVAITWPLPAGATNVVGCPGLIDTDTPPEGVEVGCGGDFPDGIFGGSALIKRDATPPVASVPDLEVVEGDLVAALVQASDGSSGIAELQFITWDTDGDGLFDDDPVFTALDGVLNPDCPTCYTEPEFLVARVPDRAGNVTTAVGELLVYNAPPVVGAVSLADVTGVDLHLGGTTALLASFTDAGVLDTHTASCDFGDGSPPVVGQVTESDGSGSMLCEHAYDLSGDFQVTLTVTDKDEAECQEPEFLAAVPLPETSIDAIILPHLDLLLAQAVLNDGQHGSLWVKAAGSAAHFAADELEPALGKLGAFSHEVDGLVSGDVLPAEYEDPQFLVADHILEAVQ
jgi:hypothetical protein